MENKMKFDKLNKMRSEQFRALDNDDMRGTIQGTHDKYSDVAHFVWELIQNADDAQASKAYFELYDDKLVFRHNGKKRFSISDIDENGNSMRPLGDVNAITAIPAKSGKQESKQATIGKFGLGFKSVFHYTDAPEIYDDNLCFKIENTIVPVWIEEDYPSREKGETVFVLKFRQKERKKAVSEILEKLQGLENPTLFLNKIKRINWVFKDESHTFKTTRKEKAKTSNLKCEVVEIVNNEEKKRLLMFSRDVKMHKEKYEISLGFYMQSRSIVKDVSPNIYCFFPTKDSYGLNFVAHAPFLLSDNRGNLKEGDDVNDFFHQELANLFADSLKMMCKFDKEEKSTLFNWLLFERYLKLFEDFWHFGFGYGRNRSGKKMFFDSFRELIRNDKVLLSKEDKYVNVKDCVLAEENVYKAFSSSQLCALFDEKLHLLPRHNQISRDFLKKEFGVLELQWDAIAEKISGDFMQNQKSAWISELFSSIINSDKTQLFKHSDIIKRADGSWTSAFRSSGEMNVYAPSRDFKTEFDVDFVDEQFFESHRDFCEKIGIVAPDYQRLLENELCPKYSDDTHGITDNEAAKDMEWVVGYWKSASEDNRRKICVTLKKYWKFRCLDGMYREWNNMYEYTEAMEEYFSKNAEKPLVDLGFYTKICSSCDLLTFLEELKFSRELRVFRGVTGLTSQLEYRQHQNMVKCIYEKTGYKYRETNKLEDFFIDGLDEAVFTKRTSLLLWDSIKKFGIKNILVHFKMHFEYKVWNGRGPKVDDSIYDSSLFYCLTELPWVFIGDEEDGKLPREVKKQDFKDCYTCEDIDALNEFCKRLNFFDPKDVSENEFEMIEMLKSKGIYNPEELNARLSKDVDGEENNEDELQGTGQKRTNEVVRYIGRELYRRYIEESLLKGDYREGAEGEAYDFNFANQKFICVSCASKSFKNDVPLHITTTQNRFMKEVKNADFAIVKISLSDLGLSKDYSAIRERYFPDFCIDNPGVIAECDRIVSWYWEEHSRQAFRDEIKEYVIRIESL